MANLPVETVNTSADKAKLGAAVALVLDQDIKIDAA